MKQAGRIITENWDLYDTRHVVYQSRGMSAEKLKEGYDFAYREFYRWSAILKAGFHHQLPKHIFKHLAYAGGWKKFEAFWNVVVKTGMLQSARPLLEAVLSKVNPPRAKSGETVLKEDTP